jgi:transposase
MQFLPELELIDRLCIARIKYERTGANNQDELDWYEARYQEMQAQLSNAQCDTLEYNIAEITRIHNQIWDLEWQLKSGVEQMLTLDEIGRRAIAIRDWNNKRITYKNSIAELFGLQLREIKTDHLSDSEQLFKTADTK